MGAVAILGGFAAAWWGAGWRGVAVLALIVALGAFVRR